MDGRRSRSAVTGHRGALTISRCCPRICRCWAGNRCNQGPSRRVPCRAAGAQSSMSTCRKSGHWDRRRPPITIRRPLRTAAIGALSRPPALRRRRTNLAGLRPKRHRRRATRLVRVLSAKARAPRLVARPVSAGRSPANARRPRWADGGGSSVTKALSTASAARRYFATTS